VAEKLAAIRRFALNLLRRDAACARHQAKTLSRFP
jgi:hypothetical protein